MQTPPTQPKQEVSAMTKNSIAYNRTLFIKDNLPVLRGLDSKSVDLIATDPPFNKGVKDFSGKTKAGVEVSYKDVWNWDDDVHDDWIKQIGGEHPKLYNSILHANESAGDDMGAFLCFMAVRVLEMERILKDTGSIYLHCDPTASHYLKAMMDAIFGRQNFRNEIRWAYRGENLSRRKWARGGDSILFYTRSDSHVFNPRARVTDEEELKSLYPQSDTHGRYKLTSCQNNADRPNMVYEWNGHTRQWRFQRSTMEEYERDGRLVYNSDGIPRRKTYMGESLAGGR